MVNDAILQNQNKTDKETTTCQEYFCNIVQVAQQPLHDECTSQSEISTAVRLFSIKSHHKML